VTNLATNQPTYSGFDRLIAIDSGYVYWNANTSLFATPLVGGDITEYAPQASFMNGLVTYGGSVYWTADLCIYKQPSGSGYATMRCLDSGNTVILRAVDEAGLYLTVNLGSGTTLIRATMEAGSPLVTLASLEDSTIKLVTDATSVYWTNPNHNGTATKTGRVLKLTPK
jgi:hypothetical protein